MAQLRVCTKRCALKILDRMNHLLYIPSPNLARCQELRYIYNLLLMTPS